MGTRGRHRVRPKQKWTPTVSIRIISFLSFQPALTAGVV
ncbi:hypothetical protein T261_07295 [Streptomyces lydicus]|nr:hypothetical protein T261_07295 [Streptomyces lydicus]